MSIPEQYIRVEKEKTGGHLEIATTGSPVEPIYVRQYKRNNSKPFVNIEHEATLLDEDGNTSFPGTLTASNIKADNETRLAAAETNIITLQTNLNNKANTKHTHNSSDITFNSSISFKNNSLDPRSITFQSGNSDNGRILFGSTASDAGYLEIATADNGNEPIYVRQYTGTDFNTKNREAILLDGNGNSSFPGTLTASNVKTDNETRLAAVEDLLKEGGIEARVFKIQYPVGSMITLNTNTNPSTYLKFGTWETSDSKAPYTFTRTT